MPALRLALTDYTDDTRWRWVLSEDRGLFIDDHEVHLKPCRERDGFVDLNAYLTYNEPAHPPAQQLAALGGWIGEQVFGRLRAKLRDRCEGHALPVLVTIPEQADRLLARPFELARLDDGRRLDEAGVRFVYQVGGAPELRPKPDAAVLRLLAVFSLPGDSNPLNLRRERYGLQQLVRRLSRTGRAVELRVIQYGATRQTLRDALREGGGWDVIHLSGHGRAGELLLEDERGREDTIKADELAGLLAPARARLKLLVLDSCASGATSHAEARAQLGLDRDAVRSDAAEATGTPLPNLARQLAARLDCAALAMRYPVGDAFATELMLGLYDALLDKDQPLPAALQIALEDALNPRVPQPPLSSVTPMLVGGRAATLELRPPPAPPGGFALPQTGLTYFESEPRHFVGRVQILARASAALAPRSQQRGVIFSGMPGAGKTACALELSYRHEGDRFQGYVWFKAPAEGSDITSALFDLMLAFETQLNEPDLGLTVDLDRPDRYRRFMLPRLTELLRRESLLIVLDNLESLLTSSGGWRDPLWGDVVNALLAHDGLSRLVLTSRRVPATLERHPGVLRESVHALSFAESVLLARELPGLARLFDDDEGLKLLAGALKVAQGHPKIVELADGLAADRRALRARVEAATREAGDRADVLEQFLAAGVTREGETRQGEQAFFDALRGWTAGALARQTPAAGLLFAFLCRLEPEDRVRWLLDANWDDFLKRLGPDHRDAAAALDVGEGGLDGALDALARAGLIEVKRPDDPAQQAQTTYGIHPGVAEATLGAAAPGVGDAADVELGNFWDAAASHYRANEMQGNSRMVAMSARCAAPYLLRQARWQEASVLLEQMLQRDQTPATLGFALPLLRRIAAATAGSERELIDAGLLASALLKAGRTDEAEPLLREVIDRAAAQGAYRVASSVASYLLRLLMATGRAEEALEVAEAMASYTRQAGLGPWKQLADEGRRLQVLNALGRYSEVLQAVETLRPQMAALPLTGDADGTSNPWNVREGLLDTGGFAAMQSEQWEAALALNAECVAVTQERGADALELARTRFNDYFALLRLRRYDEAKALLLACRTVFEQERSIEMLGKVYGALADLEDQTGGGASAARFEEAALRYTYLAGDPESCAISHNNLANYLARTGGDPALALAHRLAAATLFLQMRSGHLRTVLGTLARTDLPPAPPPFAAVVAAVEQVPGVRFGEMFGKLPRIAPDGDAAIVAVWGMVAEETRQREERWQQQKAAFEPLLQRIAAAATDEAPRAELEADLAELEQKGWMLLGPARRLWAGERDAAKLTEGLDEQDSALVRRALAIVGGG